MTTISYDGKSVVADRYWGSCYGDKLTMVGDKIIGFTGSARMFNRVVEYFTSGGEEPDIDTDEILVVDAVTGQATIYDGKMDPIEVDCPVAVGSGYAIAMGVMLQGGDAMDAVLLAATYDKATKVDHGVSQYYVGVQNSGN